MTACAPASILLLWTLNRGTHRSIDGKDDGGGLDDLDLNAIG
jgi:hypothetical protein